MPDGLGFVPLDAFLRQLQPADRTPADPSTERAAESPPPGAEPCPCAGALAAARRFHAALADALDVALEGLLRNVACDVLARELSLAPADIAAIAARALAQYAGESPVRIRVHPEETFLLDGAEIPVVPDCRLRRGDVAIDVECGTIDAGLGARLLCVLERAS